jgi:pyridoxamine 5'-phosphate oxidase family protein
MLRSYVGGMTFKPHELEFLRQAELGRLATIQSNGTPQNSPVGFTFNEQLGTIDITGYQMAKSQKYRNIAHNNKVAFVVDDITSRDPWRVRCLEIRGTAEQAQIPASRGAAGDELDTATIRVTPRRIISFGIDDQDTEPHQLTADIRDV